MNTRLEELLAATTPLDELDAERESSVDESEPNLSDFLARRQLTEGVAANLSDWVETTVESSERVPWQPGDDKVAETVARRLLLPTTADLVHGVDFILELRAHGELLLRFRAVASFLSLIAAGDDWLKRENQMGYHFHYLATRRKLRTNILLTFDPEEPVGPPDSLFWEHHASGKRTAAPAMWGNDRKLAVFDAANRSLRKPGKSTFRAPSRGASVLLSR